MRNIIIYLTVLFGLLCPAYGTEVTVLYNVVQQGDTSIVKEMGTVATSSPAAAAPRAAFNPGKIGINQALRPGEVPDRIINEESASSSNYPDRPISYYWEYFIGETEEVGCYEEEVWRRIPGATWVEYQPGPIMQHTKYRRVATNGIETATTSNLNIYADFSHFYPGDICMTDTVVNYGASSFYFTTAGDSWTDWYLPGTEWEFQYEISTDNVRWKAVEPNLAEGCGGTFMDDGTDACFYYQLPLYQTTYFRRRTTKGNWTGKSNVIKVRVTYNGTIDPGTVGPDQTIVIGQYPEIFNNITSASAEGVSSNDILYEWEYSTDNVAWSSVGPLYEAVCMWGDHCGPNYEHYFTIDSTTYFRRKASVLDKSAYSNVITVNTRELQISGGLIGYDQIMEKGQTPAPFVNIETASCELAGTFTYQWQYSTNNVSWMNISGAVQAGYQHAQAINTPTYFRRMAKLGWRTVYSNSILVCFKMNAGRIEEYVRDTAMMRDVSVKSIMPASGGASKLMYQWESYADGKWIPISSVDSNQPSLSAFYIGDKIVKVRRKVSDGTRSAYSNVCFLLPYIQTDWNFIANTKFSGYNDSVPTEANTTIQYVDGLGYLVQTVQVQASPNRYYNEDEEAYCEYQNIMTPVYYDEMHRTDAMAFLPYANYDPEGKYNPMFIMDQVGYYYREYGSQDQRAAFSKTIYDGSPLSRPVARHKPGSVYLRGNEHRITITYGLNGENEVLYFDTDMTSHFYPKNKLFKTKEVDEDGHINITYTNLSGQKVVTETIGGQDTLRTHYVYDDHGRLVTIIPPGAMPEKKITNISTEDPEFLYCYSYSYDDYGNITHYGLPGDQNNNVYCAYNHADKLVRKYHSSLYETPICMDYDGLGRLLTSRFETMQGDTILSQVVYDKYPEDAVPLQTVPGIGLPNVDTSISGMKMHERIGCDEKGVGDSVSIKRTYYYDRKGRLVQTAERNHLGGIDAASLVYGFSDNIIAQYESHSVSADAVPDVVVKKMKYDHQGRLLADTTVVNGTAPAVVSYQYNDLGMPAGKVYGTGDNKIHETIKYNLQGWLSSKESEYFDVYLRYYEGDNSYYDGSISEYAWGYRGKDGYKGHVIVLDYDRFGRFEDANMSIDGESQNDNKPEFFGERDATYDLMGNLLTLTRHSADSSYTKQQYTNFRYTYDNNKLVALNAESPGDIHYEYDTRGNLLLDRNKGLQFEYNYLNLLKQVKGTDPDNMLRARYLYSNDGVKLGVKDGSGNAGYEYLGSLVYRREGDNLVLESVPFSGGRIIKASGDYNIQYHLTDHLGSVRVIVDQNGEVLERNDYFPFGKRHDDPDLPVSTNRYRFSGKEVQTTGDLGLLDFGARMYDAEVCRWWNVDPLADKRYSVSPYNFVQNDPVNRTDPDGMLDDWYESSGGSVIWSDDNASEIKKDDEVYKNIGTSYSMKMSGGGYVNYYQNQALSISSEASDVLQTIRDNPALLGKLLGRNSPLSSTSQQGLMTDMIHCAQNEFMAGAVDMSGSVLETTGNTLAVAGYAVSATGAGAGVGAAMSGIGNLMSYTGAALKSAIYIRDGNYGQVAITAFGALTSAGIGSMANYGAAGNEVIQGGINLFFAPMNTMIGNTKYDKKK